MSGRPIERYLIDMIIVLEAMMIGMSYFQPAQVTIYYLFTSIGLCLLVGSMASVRFFGGVYKQKNHLAVLAYVLCIVATLFYGVVLRSTVIPSVVFVSSVMFLAYMYYAGLDSRNLRILIAANVPLAVLHLVKSLDSSAYNQYPPHHLTLAYVNPNMAGIVIVSTVFILIVGVLYARTRLLKLALGVLTAACMYILCLTGNRASLLSLAAFLLLFLLYRRRAGVHWALRATLILMPILIVLLYRSLPSYIAEEALFLGKPFFSGRSAIWSGLVDAVVENPLSIHRLPTGGLNMCIAGLIEFGFLGFLAYMTLLLLMKPAWKPVGKLRYRQAGYLAFLCVFIQQSFESTLLLGSYGVYIFSYTLLGIACSKDATGPACLPPKARIPSMLKKKPISHQHSKIA